MVTRLTGLCARMLGCVVALLVATADAGAAETIRAAYEDRELPPYYMGNSTEIDAQAPGVSVEMMREAAKELGVQIQFVRMPWVRCLKSLQRGEVDMVFNASFKEDRLEAGVYPMVDGRPDPARRIATVAYNLYRLKGGPVAFTGKAITGLDGPVGAPSGYSIIDDLKRMGVATEEAVENSTNFKKLVSGRIAAVATLDVSGDALIKDYPTIEKVSPPLVTKDYFVLVSHQLYGAKPDLAERLWRKIADVRERNGAALYAKYAR